MLTRTLMRSRETSPAREPYRAIFTEWSPPRLPAKEPECDEQPEDAPGGDDGQMAELEPRAGRVRVPGGEHGLEEVADREDVGEGEDAVRDLVLGDEDTGQEVERQHGRVGDGRRRLSGRDQRRQRESETGE